MVIIYLHLGQTPQSQLSHESANAARRRRRVLIKAGFHELRAAHTYL